MCKRWIAADYNRLTVCLNATALALGSKVTTDFNEREREREKERERKREREREREGGKQARTMVETIRNEKK